MTRIFLFDIDGTIMLSGGAGSRSMERVFRERYGIDNAFADFQFQGKVDPAIFREALARHDIVVPDPDAEIRTLIARYEEYIVQEMPKSDQAFLYQGVDTLIRTLAERRDVSIGLLTGNVYGGAKAKLSHWDLWRYFPYGAFGSDHEDRPRLVPIALERAGRHLGREVHAGPHVYIIGDTPADIETAKINRCTAVGIGQLNYTTTDLAARGADIVLDGFSDNERVLQALGVNHA